MVAKRISFSNATKNLGADILGEQGPFKRIILRSYASNSVFVVDSITKTTDGLMVASEFPIYLDGTICSGINANDVYIYFSADPGILDVIAY